MNLLELAFEQALLAVGVSYPNPAVGAVVVKDGTVVGRGHTQIVHGPHAEVMALRDAGEAARGATLYVTLEPCCHYGRTPPCTNAIIAAGIREVFFAHRDPNPLVFGKSEKILADAGIPSHYAEPPADFANYYEAYDYFVKNKRTFVECKIAESAEGFIANSDRTPLKITGDMANTWTAKWSRTAECILIGGGTAISDNPRLTVRGVTGNSPRKAVFAGHRILSSKLALFENAERKPLIFSQVPQPELKDIAEVVELKSENFAENWKQVVGTLSEIGYHRVAVETGATLANSILESGLWNRFTVLKSKKHFENGLSWRTGLEPDFQKVADLGEDSLFTAVKV